MGIEEQKEEREVLASIFPDEIIGISEDEFQVSIALDLPNDTELSTEPPILLLHIRYPLNYPDEAPELNISAPHGTTSFGFFSVHEDKERLLNVLKPVVQENIGMAMVFTLVSTLKDGAESLATERRNQIEIQRVCEAAKQEEEENKKFHGTSVNRETFLRWRNAFILEAEELKRKRLLEKEAEDKKKRSSKDEVKMTGRELWEKGLVETIDDDDDDDDGDEVASTIERLNIDS